MRVLWSAVLVCSSALASMGCGESSSTDVQPNGNGGQFASTGGFIGGGGIVASSGGVLGGGGVVSNGGVPSSGGFIGAGGLPPGNGGVQNAGGGFSTGGVVGAGGLVATGGFVGTGGDVQPTGGAPGSGGATVGPYPAGPYGSAVGNTFPNIQLQGYVNDSAVGIANTKPFVALYTMDDLRVSGARYALIHNSEFF